jgi:hypothetical protein
MEHYGRHSPIIASIEAIMPILRAILAALILSGVAYAQTVAVDLQMELNRLRESIKRGE